MFQSRDSVAAFVLACTLSACAVPPKRAPEPAIDVAETDWTVTVVNIGRSVTGRQMEAIVFGAGPEDIMILASIHGSEPAGTPLVAELREHLLRHPELLDGKRLVIVPQVNPDGFDLRRRHNENGVDLNRNFPAANRENSERYGTAALSEPESQAIFDLIDAYPPTRVVSIHQPLACVDYDGPAGKLAAAMARQCDLPVRRLGSRPGSLGSYVGIERRTPIITFELRKGEEDLGPAGLWSKYGRALLAFIAFEPDDAAE